MPEILYPAVIEAIQAAARAYGIPALAAEMDIKASSLYNRLNPWSDRQAVKLGLEEAIFMLCKTGDFSALRMIAEECGFFISPIESCKPDKPTIPEECLDDFHAVSDFARAVQAFDASSKQTAQDKLRITTLAGKAKDEIDQTAALTLKGVE